MMNNGLGLFFHGSVKAPDNDILDDSVFATVWGRPFPVSA
jgi:hypothetical protein